MSHKYHFVLSKKLKYRIQKEAKNEKISVSKLIRKIFKEMKFTMEQIQLKSRPMYFSYNFIKADCEIFAYFDSECYLFIANIQDSLKTYSKAQIVRYVLKLYYELQDSCSKNRFNFALANYRELWEREKKSKRIWDKSHMLQNHSDPYSVFVYSKTHELQKALLL